MLHGGLGICSVVVRREDAEGLEVMAASRAWRDQKSKRNACDGK